jgi:hypothetical protein
MGTLEKEFGCSVPAHPSIEPDHYKALCQIVLYTSFDLAKYVIQKVEILDL